jgi:transposase
MVAADARTAIVFALSPSYDDAPRGRALLEESGPMPASVPMLMDRTYEGNETRQLVLDLGMIPVVPRKANRLHPWGYDHAIYKKRNEIERLFRRLKGFPPHLLTLRTTRRPITGLLEFRAHRRKPPASSVNTP